MKKPIRVTVALDEENYEIFNRLKDEMRVSQSELIRKVLKFYSIYRDLEKHESEKIKIYVEMLAEEEHVILDIDHWITFLRFIETHPEKEEFWNIHRDIAKAHAEQFMGKHLSTPAFPLHKHILYLSLSTDLLCSPSARVGHAESQRLS